MLARSVPGAEAALPSGMPSAVEAAVASLLGEDERRMLMRPRLRMGASRAEPIRFMGDRPRLGEACTPCGMVLHHSI